MYHYAGHLHAQLIPLSLRGNLVHHISTWTRLSDSLETMCLQMLINILYMCIHTKYVSICIQQISVPILSIPLVYAWVEPSECSFSLPLHLVYWLH